MEELVPLISSTVAGPLGVVHLPRMWLKAVLAEVGALRRGWVADYRGFNQQVLDALGIDEAQFFRFMATLPSYAETERWVVAHARHLERASVNASNEEILSKQRPDERAAPARDRVGLADPTYRISARLNDLDDWYTVYEWLVERRGEPLAPIVPTVSSSSAGPLGLKHLPRLWMKALLNRAGALPDDYNSGCGFDAYVSQQCGLDLDAAIAFIHDEFPSYLAFEHWVRVQVTGLDDVATLDRHNAAILGRRKPEEKAAAERLESGVPELAFREVIMCNDMLDWKALHDEALARRIVAAT